MMGGAALLAALAAGQPARAVPGAPAPAAAPAAMDPADARWCARSRQRLNRLHRRMLRQRGMPSEGQAGEMQRLRIQRERRCPEAG